MVSQRTFSVLVHRLLLPLVVLLLFSAALWFLHDALSRFHYHQVLGQLRTIPLLKVLAALGLTFLSYLAMMFYDRLAITYVGHPLERRKIALASFVSYAFSNTIGLSLLTAGSIRYRLYSAWGLATEEIARLVTFTVATFWLGILAIGGIIFVFEPLSMPPLGHLALSSARPVGLVFVTLIIAYMVGVFWRKRVLHIGNWELPIPSPRLAGAQLLLGSIDWALAASVLYSLLPAHSGLSFPQFLGIFLLAQVVALISHVPGGLGVFESMILISTPGLPADALFGSLLLYRGIYYLMPLAFAALLLAGNEFLQRRSLLKQATQLAGRWASVMIPQLLAATTLVCGAVLLFSAATPTLLDRLRWLEDFLPLSVIEFSHFLGSLVGAGLLLLARGLQRRLDAAYLLAAILLAAGSAFSILKGADYEESLLLILMLLALLPCRRYFYRKASLLSEPFSFAWTITLLLVLLCSAWLGLFAYKHVSYSSQLWWQFALHGDAPRFLRAAVGVTALLLVFGVAKLLRPAPRDPELPDQGELARAKLIVDQCEETNANLALLGDKALLFDDKQCGFVMYGIQRSSWVALGDPVGPADIASELAWEYRVLVERHGGQAVFYAVGTRLLHVYLDMGLTLFKLGEQGRVPLSDFSLAGAERKGLRYTYNRLNREGCVFEVRPAAEFGDLLPELKRVSDAWLENKRTREKGFSLGRFDERYLRNFPVALVRQKGRIVAFANLWCGAGRQELSIDLMRFDGQAHKGVMEYLFISLLLWGQQQGYRFFDLGMAPLSGLENRPFAPLWHRIGAVVFQHGEHFYNFEGLREYKEKFSPIWEPRYLAGPGGLALPRILINIATLISGSLKGVMSK